MNSSNSAAGRLGRLLCVGLIAFAGFGVAQAAEIRIKMLDSSASGPLAFEPDFVKADPGDTIIFEPTHKGGHSAVSLLVPPGARPWSGATDKETRLKLDKEGIYLHACTAHKRMGMVGVAQVGKPVNLEEARKIARDVSSGFVLNKERLEKELARIK